MQRLQIFWRSLIGTKLKQIGVWRNVGKRRSLPRFCGLLNVRELGRSEEHTSELQSLRHLVCRLLLEKKKNKRKRKKIKTQTATTAEIQTQRNKTKKN